MAYPNNHNRTITPAIEPVHKIKKRSIPSNRTGTTGVQEQKEYEKRHIEELINCTNDLLWSVSSDFKLITANRSFLKALKDSVGMDLKPGDNLLIKDVFPNELVAFWETCYTKALSGESFKEEIYTPAFNKRKASWTDTSFNPIYNNDTIVGIACSSRDITEKKLAEEKIRQSEARLIEAQEVAKVGSWETDLVTFDLVWSKETYNIFDIDPIKFQSSHPGFLAFVHPDDQAKVEAAFTNSLNGYSVNTIEHRIITPSGLIKIVEERWRVYRDENGQPVRAVGTCRDITESKIAEAAIKKVYEEKNTLLERIDDGFFAVDNSSIITYWNNKVEILLDAKREDVIGKNLHELFAPTGSVVFYDNYQKAIREKSTVHFEGFSKRSNKWFAVSAYGSDNGLSVYFKDVTEQKNAEEKIKESELRYRSLIEQATDTICIADRSMKFIDVNPSGCRMFGYPGTEVLQLSLTDVLFAEDLKTNALRLDELKAGKTIWNERRIKRKDGSAVLVELSSKMLEDGRIIIFGRDISERKESERLIKESEAKYRSFFESSMDGILLTVTDGAILSANPAACEIFKMTEEEICAAGRLGVVDLTDPRVNKLIEERQRTGKAKGEITLVRKDGSKFQAELTSAVFTDGLGQKRTSMIVRDITERKEAELMLSQSNERYNLISKATNDMVWDWNLVTGAVYRNKEGWKKIFRTGEKEFEVLTMLDWDNRIHPEDLAIVKKVNEEIYKSEKDFFEVECRVMRDDGTYAHIHDRGNIVRDEQGKALRLLGATQDITERKEAELQLAKSELRFRSLVQNSSDLVSILDENTNYLYSSCAVKRILGYEPEFMIGKTALSFIHPDDVNMLRVFIEKIKAGGYVEVTPFRFKNSKGEWRWLESKINDMRNDPDVQGYVVNSRDVTERKIAEEEIKKLSIIAKETVNAVIITDPEGRIIWVNEAFTRITEFELEEVIFKKPGDFLRGDETNMAVVEYMRSEIKKLKAFECDIINYSKSGRKYWMHIQCQPQFDENGNLKYFFAIETDITKEKEAKDTLKASEEQYRYLFNNNPSSIIIWDLDNFHILEVNNTAEEEYGYNRAEFLNKTTLELRTPEDCDRIKQFAERAKRKDDFKSENTWKHINASGEEMYMNIGSHRIQYKGRPSILSLGTNITDKVFLEKALEEERQAKQKEITDAVISAQEQERQQLGSELHDNITQILAGSRLYLGLVRTELETEHPHLNETDKLIKSAIDELRNLSHSLIPPSLNESALLEALRNIIETTQLASGVQIMLDAPCFSESLTCDKLKLTIYRIVQEQLNNILKYACAGKVIVTLDQQDDKMILSIKDDGIGFNTTIKARGVGLMNIKTRAALFNGEMKIISSVGNGCELLVAFN